MTTRASASTRVALAIALALVPAAAAHSPHDIAELVRVSPDFANDQTVFATLVLTEHALLGRSLDGGRSWDLYAPPMMIGGLRQLAFSPAFATDRTLFAASDTLGVWRSTDGGLSWAPVNAGLADVAVIDLALSPGFGIDRTLLAVTGSGCFRSSDAGESWAAANDGLLPEPLTAVCFASPTLAFAGGQVVHRSVDGGLSWTPLQGFTFPIAQIAAGPAPAGGTAATVCFGRYGDGLRVSLDDGGSWAPLAEGLTDPFVNQVEFASDGTLFAITRAAGCFRAPEAGAPFVLLDQGFEHPSGQSPNHYLGLGVSPAFPADHTVFVAAFEGLHRSLDQGELWEQLDVYSQRINRRVILAAGAHGQPQLLLGNYGGGLQLLQPAGAFHPSTAPAGSVATSAPATGQPTAGAEATVGPTRASAPAAAPPGSLGWSARADGLGALWTEVLEASPDYAADGTLLLGHIGLWLSTDRGAAWTQLPLPPGELPVRAAAFSPGYATDHTLFAAREEGGVFVSSDSGQTWDLVDDGLPLEDSMSFIRLSPEWPADPLGLIASKSGAIYRSSDAGASWQGGSGLPGTEVRALELSPAFAVDRFALAGTVGDGVYRSTDGGASWEPSGAGLPAGIPLVVEGLACSPGFQDDGTAFLSLITGGVWRSTDHGASWSLVSEGLPLAAPRVLGLSPDFVLDGRLVLLTHDWAWESLDRGAHWSPLPGFLRVDDSHPSVSYVGAWKAFGGAGVNGPGSIRTLQPGAYTEIEFEGRSVDWFARTGPEEGTAAVLVDGRLEAVLDLGTPLVDPQAKAFSRSFSEVGWHTLRVVAVGPYEGNPSARVFSDGFAYGF